MTSAADLLHAITESSEWGFVWSPPARHSPADVTWTDEACFKLLALMAGENPDYIHAELSNDESGTDRVVLFMPSSILVLTVGATTGQDARWRDSSVQAVPRSSVIGMRIDGSENLLGQVGAEWPSRATVAVTIEGVGEVRMPSSRATPACRRGLVNLLPSLIRDLSA